MRPSIRLEAHPDVVLCCIDWNMPVMTGFEFVVEARKRQEWRDITLMMVTTEGEHDQIVRALAAGAHEYVIKPFTPEIMLDKARGSLACWTRRCRHERRGGLASHGGWRGH
ncbi:response regulator [Demequina litorisediminis]|uniref:response regulator n=1 Tax=Demequina litorisediminis TaxID=1849022 RepID=UPI0032AF9AEC